MGGQGGEERGWGHKHRKSLGARKGGWPERVGGPRGWVARKGGGPKGWVARKGGGPEPGKKWGPEGWRPRRVGARRVGGPKFRAFFSYSRRKISFFSSLSGVFSWNFGGVLKTKTSNVHVWSSRVVVCEPRRPGLVGPPGFHTTAREPKRAQFAPTLQTPPKFHEKTPQRERERERERKKERKMGAGEEKKGELLGGPAEGGLNQGVVRRRAVRTRGGPNRGGVCWPKLACPAKSGWPPKINKAMAQLGHIGSACRPGRGQTRSWPNKVVAKIGHSQQNQGKTAQTATQKQ